MRLMDELQSGSIAQGVVEIYLVANGLQMVDGGGIFGLVPRLLWEKVFTPDQDNRIPMATKSLLILVDSSQGRQVILVDTGNGTKWSEKRKQLFGITDPDPDLVIATTINGQPPESELEANLRRLNLSHDAITTFVCSHLHGDHAGGNTRWTIPDDEHAPVVPTFPNATYYACEREWQDYIQPNERTRATYLPENMLPVQQHGQLQLIPQGRYEIVPGVHCIPTPGHTPGHWSILVRAETIRIGAVGRVGQLLGQESNAGSLLQPMTLPGSGNGLHMALFGADAAMYAVHLERLAWIPSYDLEPLVSLETKRVLQQWGLMQKPLFLFDHDPFIAAGYLTSSEGKFAVVPHL